YDDGTPTQDKERFRVVMEAIAKACPGVIIQPSTGGAVGMTNDERLQATELNPEMATLDCGTLNFGGDEIFQNTENTIKYFGQRMIERGIKPELEVFDKSMIEMALRLHKKGYILSPMHFDFVMGVNGGIGGSLRDFLFLRGSIPSDATYTVAGLGRFEMPLAAAAIIDGGHVRVGFEDNVFLSKGVLAKSNGELVAKVVRMAVELGREIATPSEARQILGLPKRK
ncbi:MAG TPA: 3-keto-5-aminohexanoate cleavage protein, partial [Bacteroidales bacterium]|nr:3-keto-5-aminohexanoate cleavage protein [Bacteroidales bacterium]